MCRIERTLLQRPVRTTAHGLYTQVFTEPFVDENRIHAVFCMAVDKHGDVRAVHVAGYMGDNLYMNESSCEPMECGHVRTLSELRRIYSDCFLVRRNLRSGAWA